MTRLVRSELLKLRTTNTWWIFAIVTIGFTAISFFFNAVQADSELDPYIPDASEVQGMPEEQRASFEEFRQEQIATAAKARTATGLANIASTIYTTGQFFGLLFVMLLAILIVTNEYHHQTATATFLTTPQRTRVIVSKLITAGLLGALFWLVTTVLVVIAGIVFFASYDVDSSLDQWIAQRSVLLNLVAYLLWAVFGVGIGVLIRSQLGATITSAVLYVVGTFAAFTVLAILYELVFDKADWVLQGAVLIPPLASQHMVSGIENQVPPEVDLWPRWSGAIVMFVWAAVAGMIGTLITRKRDIS